MHKTDKEIYNTADKYWKYYPFCLGHEYRDMKMK